MTKKKDLTFNFMFSLFIIIFIVCVWIFTDYSTTQNTVKCYDKNNNEIIGLECKQTTNPININFAITLVGLAITFILGLIDIEI